MCTTNNDVYINTFFTMESSEAASYLTKKYIAIGLMAADGTHTGSIDGYDPFLYPDTHHIPPCGACVSDLEKAKQSLRDSPKDSSTLEIGLTCTKACLWHDLYLRRLAQIMGDRPYKTNYHAHDRPKPTPASAGAGTAAAKLPNRPLKK